MAGLDDLLEPSQAASVEEFNKEEWAAKKKSEREGLYALADETALSVAADPARFVEYLDTQARFDRYSTTNALLIMAQKPTATRVGDLDYWKSQRVFIKGAELKNAITILEPGRQYQRADGGVGTSVNAKRVYDASQVERPRLEPQPRFEVRPLVAALVKASPVPAMSVEQQEGFVRYSPEAGKIFSQRGQEGHDLIRGLAREICRAEFLRQHEGAEPEAVDFAARSGAHFLCRKFGVSPDGISLADAPKRLGSLGDARAVRDALSDMRKVYCDVAGRMSAELEAKSPNREARS